MTTAPKPHDHDNTLFRAGDPDFMTSLARGLHVIRAFTGFDRRLTIADVSRAAGLTRAVVRRCLYTLRELGYAGTDGRTFFLQPKVLNLRLRVSLDGADADRRAAAARRSEPHAR